MFGKTEQEDHMAREPSGVLDEKFRGLWERYESELSDAIKPVTEGLSGEIRVDGRGVRGPGGRSMSLKGSLKAARKEASRQVLAQIAAMIESRPDMTYREIAESFGIGTSMVCEAAKLAGVSRPRGSASPAFRKKKTK